MYIRLAWRNLWRNKRRTLITVASVLFAVLLAIVMRSMQLGSYDNMVNNAVRFYSGFAQVHKNGFWNEQSLENTFIYSDSLTRAALKHPDVEELIPRLESFALASYELRTRGVSVIGIDAEEEKRLTEVHKKIIRGDYFANGSNTALLTSGLSEYLNADVGDTVILIGQGYQGANAAGKYAVSGIVKFNNPELNKRFVFLSLPDAQWLFNAENRLSALVAITQPEQVNSATAALRNTFGSEYETLDWREMMPELVQAIEADSIGGVIILAILYIVIGFGIFGTILMMTTERRHEFGVLIALGMKRWKLLLIITLESVMLAMTGVIAGIAASLPVVVYFFFNPIPLSDELAQVSESYGLEAVVPFALEPRIFIYQALSVLIISLLAMMYPLFKVFALKPSEAMRA